MIVSMRRMIELRWRTDINYPKTFYSKKAARRAWRARDYDTVRRIFRHSRQKLGDTTRSATKLSCRVDNDNFADHARLKISA